MEHLRSKVRAKSNASRQQKKDAIEVNADEAKEDGNTRSSTFCEEEGLGLDHDGCYIPIDATLNNYSSKKANIPQQTNGSYDLIRDEFDQNSTVSDDSDSTSASSNDDAESPDSYTDSEGDIQSNYFESSDMQHTNNNRAATSFRDSKADRLLKIGLTFADASAVKLRMMGLANQTGYQIRVKTSNDRTRSYVCKQRTRLPIFRCI